MTLLSDWKDQDEAIEIVKDQHEEPEWKAVGSPSRRGSLSVRVNPDDPNETAIPSLSDKKWGSFGGFQWEGPSIFEEKQQQQFNPVLAVPMLPNVPLEPTYKQKRSFSFSMGQSSSFFPYEDYNNSNNRNALSPTVEEVEEEQGLLFDDAAYLRARSQSTNAVFGMTPSSYWSNKSGGHTDRRSSLVSFLPDPPSFVSQRRMSQPVNDYCFPEFPNGGGSINPLLGRMPSVPRPERLENLTVSKSTPKRLGQDEQETAGKGLLLHKLPPHASLYCVEFKAGRSDFYYVSEPTSPLLRLEDLVIVEADRGKDLGKITSGILTIDQVLLQLQLQQQQQQQMEEDETDGTKRSSEFYVKRIYRRAGSNDVNLLQTKEQDEQRALTVCLQKITARKLSMEVVDAEYQWDRRKLTFYFNAEKRIDFRELVRELFKIYKTRIWMCAANTSNRKQV
ncbi:PSP1-domain-containing protein [Backusella circina FSU 941]|nr:PSP1-domain-containing protein [Backusella circina FSU 941]